MTELSTTEAKQVEQAAKDYLLRCKHYGSPSATPKDHFEAGIDYALSHILPSRLQQATTSPDILREILRPFLEWVDTNYCNHGVAIDKWSGRKLKQWLKEKNISGAELLEKYIQHLQTNKQKEDVNNKTI